jgi:16S rRNA (cytosine1402-N4)-methyltransferase
MMFVHRPVMPEECIEALDIKPDGVYIDGTIGGAGHAVRIYALLGPAGTLIGIDRDEEAVEASKQRLKETGGKAALHIIH